MITPKNIQTLTSIINPLRLTSVALATRMREAARIIQSSRLPSQNLTLYNVANTLEKLALDVETQQHRLLILLDALDKKGDEP